VTQDDAAALAWYQKAAAAGDWMAMGNISQAYKDGLKQDSEKTGEWYKKFMDTQLKR
jgi:TPR repeat protein